MRVEYDVPSGMKEMVDGVVNSMVISYYKAKGKPTDNNELAIPSYQEVVEYVVTGGYKNRIDAENFWKAMERRNWLDGEGRKIRNWKKLINYCIEHGEYAGCTVDPNAPLPPLPNTVRR